MKFYDCNPAPSPRRARMFIAEKGLEIPIVEVDLMANEHLSDKFKAINPQCTVPALELDDGTIICESVAISRYLEELYPDPPLFGVDALDKAMVEMWNRRIEHYCLAPVAESFRNFSKAFRTRSLTGPVDFKQVPELVERGRKRAEAFLADWDAQLADNRYITGDRFTIADITGVCTADFAMRIKIPVLEDYPNIKRWYEEVSARPSAKL